MSSTYSVKFTFVAAETLHGDKQIGRVFENISAAIKDGFHVDSVKISFIFGSNKLDYEAMVSAEEDEASIRLRIHATLDSLHGICNGITHDGAPIVHVHRASFSNDVINETVFQAVEPKIPSVSHVPMVGGDELDGPVAEPTGQSPWSCSIL